MTDAPEKIVAFPGYSVPINLAEPNNAVVELLERLLANAKIGMIRSIGVAVIDHEEKRQTSWCGDAKRSLLGYAIATLNHEYLTAIQRQNEADD